jgi:hypothetical protein
MPVQTRNLPLATQPVLTVLGHQDAGGGVESLARVPLAWANYTPVLTAQTGTLGTYTVNRARWVRLGQAVTVTFDVLITSAGSSPSGNVIMTLPVPAAPGFSGSVQGREVAAGRLIGGVVDGTQQNARLGFDNFGFAGGNGNRLIGSITYEAA